MSGVLVFDLDDTLYLERSYQDSAFEAISIFVRDAYGFDRDDAMRILESNRADALGRLAVVLGYPQLKESLIWMYRTHRPKISLRPGASVILEELKREGYQLAICTDGRSVSQRLKAVALDLNEIPLFISEEWGEVKPSQGRFKAIMNRWPDSRYFYVGDNPTKDFLAPNQLGWATVGLRSNPKHIHQWTADSLSSSHLPQFWIDNLSEIKTCL